MRPSWVVSALALYTLGSVAAPSARAQTPPADPRPRVHFTTDAEEVTLYRYRGPFAREPLCRAPCDRPFDPSDDLYFAGEDIRPSPHFSLAGKRGAVNMHVWAGKRSDGTMPKVMIGIGAAGVAGGALLLAWPHMMGSASRATGPDVSAIVGGTLIGLGAAVIVGAVVSLSRVKPTEYQFLHAGPQGVAFRF